MRRFISNILLVINILFALLLIISYFSVMISPAVSWIFAFIGMSYPFILLINVLFFIFWIIFRKYYALISLFCIALGWNSLRKFIQFRFRHPATMQVENTISILTYNVRLFNYYHWQHDTATWERIMNHIRAENPDIVCFQEFISIPGGNLDLKNLTRRFAPDAYTHVHYTHTIPGKISFGMATFSKFPIVRKGETDFNRSLNGSIYSDIVKDADTFRIFNCHLQSIRLRKEYNKLLDSLVFNYSDRQLNEIKDISLRIREAFIQRAEQVNILSQQIRLSPFPVIVCGDFNDTPVSYTYKRLSRGLKDAFIESGSGVGNTYRGNVSFIRIDYVLYSRPFRSRKYSAEKINWSDHYPVKVDFTISETADSTGRHSRH